MPYGFWNQASEALPQGMNLGMQGMAEIQRRKEMEQQLARQAQIDAFQRMMGQQNFQADESYRQAQLGQGEKDYELNRMNVESQIADRAKPQQYAPQQQTAEGLQQGMFNKYMELKRTNPNAPELPDYERFIFGNAGQPKPDNTTTIKKEASDKAWEAMTNDNPDPMAPPDTTKFQQYYQFFLKQLTGDTGGGLGDISPAPPAPPVNKLESYINQGGNEDAELQRLIRKYGLAPRP